MHILYVYTYNEKALEVHTRSCRVADLNNGEPKIERGRWCDFPVLSGEWSSTEFSKRHSCKSIIQFIHIWKHIRSSRNGITQKKKQTSWHKHRQRQTQNAWQPVGYKIAERREQKRREHAISRSRYLWATGRHVILGGGWR
ncbi:hypothetical protein TNCV_398981 [Trichonephila clavipes]|uniref:Uncharacterized protein n=1 Tax=Trichonephila clavipes TaxID=2585209 RepID=A0A8X6VTW8_TRICX|nr:hypothetical protein TNCV_398981 [Trichonephila clavipes]